MIVRSDKDFIDLLTKNFIKQEGTLAKKNPIEIIVTNHFNKKLGLWYLNYDWTLPIEKVIDKHFLLKTPSNPSQTAYIYLGCDYVRCFNNDSDNALGSKKFDSPKAKTNTKLEFRTGLKIKTEQKIKTELKMETELKIKTKPKRVIGHKCTRTGTLRTTAEDKY